jgi:hypothetical protein
VLEIGCGDAANLIPMDVSLPTSSFVGFDIAPHPVGRGRQMAERLGLANIDLEVLDLLEVSPGRLGEFDYIIAHGVYAWVGERAADGLLALIGACLAPDGLAMVSYNALPGCRVRQMIRDMLLYHVRRTETRPARLAEARSLLETLAAAYRDDEPLEAALKAECRRMLEREPAVLFHDELAEEYRPAYLHEFLDRAGRHGLHYLADAEPLWLAEEVAPARNGAAAVELAGGEPLASQQYGDFLNARLFRHTVLRRSPLAPDAQVDVARVRSLYGAVLGRPESVHPESPEGAIVLRAASGAAIEVAGDRLKRVIQRLAETWPESVLLEAFEPKLAAAFVQLWAAGVIELRAAPSRFTRRVSERPRACPLARLQADLGQVVLTTRRHACVQVDDEIGRSFISLLDGVRSHDDLAQEMARRLGQPASAIRPQMEASLAGLARLPLLVG